MELAPVPRWTSEWPIPLPAKSKYFISLKAAQNLHSFIRPVPRACPVIPKNTLLALWSWPAFRLALFGLTSTGRPSLHQLALKSALGRSRCCIHSVLRMLHVKLPISRLHDVRWPPKQSYLAQILPHVTLSLNIRNRNQLFRSIYRGRGSYIMWLTFSPSSHARTERLHSSKT